MIPLLQLTGVEAAVVVVATLAGGIIRGFTGFGSALVMAPVVSIAVGTRVAVPAIVLVLTIASAQLLPSALREADLRRVVPMGLAGCVGVPLGVYGLMTMDQDLVRRLIALVVVLFSVAMLAGWRYQRTPGATVSMSLGGLGGVLTGAAAVGGPPVIAFLLSGPDRAAANRAAIILYFMFTQTVAIALYWAGDAFTQRVLWLTLLMLPAQLAGVWVGAILFPLASETLFRRVALGFLLAIGLVTLVV